MKENNEKGEIKDFAPLVCGALLPERFGEKEGEGKAPTRKDVLRRLALNRKKMEKFDRDNKLARYNAGGTVHEKQMLFHKCRKRNRWVFGGNRTGKTECGAAETAWLLRGNHPYRKVRGAVTGWAVSVSYGAGREVAQKKLLSYLNPAWIERVGMRKGGKDNPDGGIVDYIAVRNVFGSVSYVYFKSCESGREKFQGSSLDFVWFDEEPPRDVYEECRMRVFDRKGDVYGTMTPLKGMTYIYDQIYLNKSGDDEVWYVCMEWKDNPYLDPKEIERLSAVLGEDALRTRRYGLFVDTGDLVYPEFDEKVHVIEPIV